MGIFTCDVCQKSFGLLHNLRRHIHALHQGNNFECSTCGHKFNRRDILLRHEKKHAGASTQTYQCRYCGKFFYILRQFKDHVENHESRINRNPYRPPQTGGALSKKRKLPSTQTQPPPKARRSKSEDELNQDFEFDEDSLNLESVPEYVPDEISEVYRRYWSSIRTHFRQGGRILELYNIRLEDMDLQTFQNFVKYIFKQQTSAFKINFSFGFVLRNVETNELRYYHSSVNNARVLDTPFLIKNESDLNEFLSEKLDTDILEHIRQQRPNTKFSVELVTNVTFYVYKIVEFPIGVSTVLPNYVHSNHAIVSLVQGAHGPYTDHLCFFRCLSQHEGHVSDRNMENRTKELFHKYIHETETSAVNFLGVRLSELEEIEKIFEINIMVFTLVEVVSEDGHTSIQAELVQRSLMRYQDTMYINLFEKHFSYIKDIERYCSNFACSRCGKMWKHVKQLNRHEQTCEAQVRLRFPGGIYKPTANIFEKLESEGIFVPEHQRYYPYRATFDIECMQKQAPENPTTNLQWEAEHELLSVSVCSNVENYTEPVCFVSEGNPTTVVTSLIEYLESISDAAYEILRNNYTGVYATIDREIEKQLNALKDEKSKEKYEKKNHLSYLKQCFDSYLRELIVLTFNGSRYDINAMKDIFFPEIINMQQMKFVVKRNSSYMCLTTDKLKILDVTNYLAPGFSYAQFLQAYDCQQSKFYFPYDYLDDVSKLRETSLPPHEEFYSKLKNANITEEEYEYCQEIWQEKHMTTLKDFLVYYNNLDVTGMLEAVDKMFNYYKSENLDAFKQAISIPGLTLHNVFAYAGDSYFSLIENKDQDLYHTMKNSIVGGPSLVYQRYMEAGKTYIREQDMLKQGREPKMCQKIFGMDCNGLYLHAAMQEQATGHYVRRRKENNFKREVNRRYERMAIEWLEWESKKRDCKIRHHGNDKEMRIGVLRIPVDGYLQEDGKRTVFQFQGCFWHGHSECTLTKDKDGRPLITNPVNGKSMEQLYKRTLENNEYIQRNGFELVELWECQWRNEKKQNKDLQKFIAENFRQPLDKKPTMTEEEILQAVRDETLFGFVECDIRVPDHLREKFAEMPPIFKNVCISRDDLGDHMKSFAEQHDIMKKPRKSLIGSMFADKIMLATPLLNWYLSHGLEVTNIYQVVESTPSACFKTFGEDVSTARREGDRDPAMKIIGETKKLAGNSCYGKSITNKEKHRTINIFGEHEASLCINTFFFRHLEPLQNDVYEIESCKKTISIDLPLQIGVMVYNLAKLKMLEFCYDFLAKYIDPSDYQHIQGDTDSVYMAISGNSLDDIVKPELKEEYLRERNLWLPRTDTPDNVAYDKRTPGLFKVECEADGIVALSSKSYFCFGDNVCKFSAKGVNRKNNELTKDTYLNVLKSKGTAKCLNRGFRMRNNKMWTYALKKDGLSYFYPKRKVLKDDTLVCVLLLCTSVYVDGLRCLTCSHVISPTHCHAMELCKDSKICLVEKYTTLTEEVLFNIGCAVQGEVTPNISTSSLGHNIDTDNSALMVDCKEYCSSDLCNSAGCGHKGYPLNRGPICYNCHQSRDISKCERIGICAENELCHVEQIDELGEQYFTTTCINKGLCDKHLINTIIGKREHSDRDALRILCSKCCHGDLCNFECTMFLQSLHKRLHAFYLRQTNDMILKSIFFLKAVLCRSFHLLGNLESTTAMSTTKNAEIATNTGHYGSRFWVAFTIEGYYSYRQATSVNLAVLSSSTVSTTINTSTNYTHYLTSVIDLPYTLIQNHNTLEENGVLVTTNTSAYVYTYTDYKTAHNGATLTWVPPYEKLGTSYIALSYPPVTFAPHHSYISIVSGHAGTNVNVTLNTTGVVNYNGRSYADGDMLTLNLNEYQSFQVSSAHDITGSTIHGNKPIAVQAGVTEYLVSHTGGCTPAASMYMPPVPAWGRTFIVPQIQTALKYSIRILPSKQTTAVSIKSKNGVNSYTLASTFEKSFDASEILLIKCNDPCFVAQFPAGESNRAVTTYMVTVPAVEQYSRNFQIISPNFLPFKSHFVSVMIKSNEASDLILNGTSVNNYQMNVHNITESNNTWSVVSVTVPQGTHIVAHTSPHTIYGVIAYGFGYCMSYGYAAGLNI